MFQQILSYPLVLGTIHSITQWVQMLWMGSVSDSVRDTIVIPWSIDAVAFFHPDSTSYSIQIPDFHPISLKHVYL